MPLPHNPGIRNQLPLTTGGENSEKNVDKTWWPPCWNIPSGGEAANSLMASWLSSEVIACSELSELLTFAFVPNHDKKTLCMLCYLKIIGNSAIPFVKMLGNIIYINEKVKLTSQKVSKCAQNFFFNWNQEWTLLALSYNIFIAPNNF